MLIKVNKSDYKKIKNLLMIKEYNIASAEALFSFTFTDLPHEELFNYLELDLDNEEELFFFEKYFAGLLKKLDENDYLNDRYAKRIKGLHFKKDKYELKNLTLKSGRLIPFDDIEIKEDYLERSNIGYFTKDFIYPALMENKTVWMSLDPNEITTMKPYIDKMHGDVLIFGLGMGYFPYMVSFNKDVKSITIIEKDKQIIDIFNQFIKPRLDNPIPFKIINDDAFNYLNNIKVDSVDTLFMDIWHNPEDGLPLYIKFLKIMHKWNKPSYYWLEKSLLAMARRCLLTIIEESLNGFSEKNYQKAKNEYDQIINDLYFKTQNIVINNYEDIISLLSDDSLKSLLS